METEWSGWNLVAGVWKFLNGVFDHACPVMAEHGLHQKSLVLLTLLDHADTPRELAALLRTPPSSLSHLLKELEAKGLITRTLDPSDKRRFRFVRTATGDAAHDAGRQAINAAVAARLGTLTEAEQQQLTSALPLLSHLL